MAADAVLDAVRLDHHGHGVPAHQALDAALDLAAARVGHLFGGVNRVQVGGVRGEGQLHPGLPGMDAQLAEQTAHPSRPALLEDVIERLEPLAGFERLEFGPIGGGGIPHGRR